MAGFSATVDAWVRETRGRQTAVFRESAQRITEEILTPVARGGHMRVDTGFMRASLTASLEGVLPQFAERPEEAVKKARGTGAPSIPFDAGPVNLVISNADIGDVITFAFAANYAQHVENRFAPVRLGAQRWPQVVAEVTAEAKGRAGA